MSRRYALRFYTFDDRQRIVPLPMEHGKVTLGSGESNIHHIWKAPLSRIEKAKNDATWPKILDWPTDNQTPASPAQESIIVLFVRSMALTSSGFFQELINGDTALRCVEPLPGAAARTSPEAYRPSPIITVSLENVMALYEESAGLDCDLPEANGWRERRERNNRLYSLGIDHRVKFLDSSIWHRYVACDDPDFGIYLLARLYEAVEYSDLRLYRSLASLASLEFQCRMLLNSFIAPLGANGHHESVTPFKFHSETHMARQAEHMLQFLRETGEGMQLIDLQWGALMVDDQANRAISTIDDLPEAQKSEGGKTRVRSKVPTKRTLIQRWLTNDATSKVGKKPSVSIDQFTKGDSEIIRKGIVKMEKRTFDVIFLDYLLGSGTLRASGREYGHEFLLELATNTNQHLHRGLLGRYWIFPISSFPFAFSDKLRQLGMDGVGDRWYISEGGDPIAAPEMFRFNFLRMALLQITECYLYPSAMVRLLERFSGIENHKEWAEAIRTSLKFMDVNQNLLKFDRRQDSTLASSMLDFLDGQPRYEKQIHLVKVLAEMMDAPIDTARYNQILSQKTEIIGHIPNHPIAAVVERGITKLLSKIDENYQRAVKDITATVNNGKSRLTLDGLGLLGLPDIIGQCRLLESINLSGNQIAKLPISMSSLTRLTHLDLAGNDFSKIPSVLKNLQRLQWLDLRKNPALGGDLACVYINKAEIAQLLHTAAAQNMLSHSSD